MQSNETDKLNREKQIYNKSPSPPIKKKIVEKNDTTGYTLEQVMMWMYYMILKNIVYIRIKY